MTALLARTRAFAPDRVVVLPQRSKARECADGNVGELFSGDAANAAAQRNGADQPPLLPALELFFRNQFSGSHRPLSLTAQARQPTKCAQGDSNSHLAYAGQGPQPR